LTGTGFHPLLPITESIAVFAGPKCYKDGFKTFWSGGQLLSSFTVRRFPFIICLSHEPVMTYDKEKERERIKQKVDWELNHLPEEPVHRTYHFHFCLVCQEDLECTIEECEIANHYICQNCEADS
jgi:hypothetical protein